MLLQFLGPLGFGFWYYLSTYLLFELIYTGIMVPYESLASEMTKDFGIRSKLTSFKAIFGKIANFAAAFIPGRFIAMYGKDTPTRFLYTGIVFGVILIAAMIFLYMYSWERSPEELEEVIKHESRLGFIGSMKKLFIDISSTFRVKTFRHHLGMYLGGFSAEWLFTSAFTYFVIFSLHQSSEHVSNLSSFNSVIQLITTYFLHQVLVSEVERLKEGGSMNDATPESREVFEKLTGFKYEKCWGRNNVGYKDRQSALWVTNELGHR